MKLDEWCTDCKEYDQEHHNCPRFNRVIRTALQDSTQTNAESTQDLISRQDAIDIADEIIARDTSGNNDVVKAMEAWKVSIKFIPSAQQWIPCSERLPEELTRVIVCTDFKFVCIAYLKQNHKRTEKPWMIYGADPDIRGSVVTWMPLPEPWKGESNELHK